MTIPKEDLEKIHRFTPREVLPQELYTFTVLLCDNEIDRDGERFSASALEKLAELFVGKTGIFDHNPKGENQNSRIYAAWVDREGGRLTQAGEAYACLKAKAYLMRSEKNRDLILEIDGGIKKEVSISCAVGKKICSVCGKDCSRESCGHKKGEIYRGKRCYHTLEDPIDAYEFSFVAVPAQKGAGVVKKRKGGLTALHGIQKLLEKDSLTQTEREEAEREYEDLQRLAEAGKTYLEDLQAQVLGASALCGFPMDRKILAQVVKGMDAEQLKAFRQGFADWPEKKNTNTAQLTRLPQMIRQIQPETAVDRGGWEEQGEDAFRI